MTDAERKAVADKAVQDALFREARDRLNGKIHVPDGDEWKPGHAMLMDDDGPLGRGEVRDVIARLIVERDEWKRRAEKHGCNVERGDPDCG